MTAEFLLHRVHPLAAGETVLVHAAAGGAGHLLCQWARAKGARVIAAVGDPKKAALARRCGAIEVVTEGQDLVERVMAVTQGRGADVVYDGIGGANLERSFAALAVKGHIVSFGQAAGPIEPYDVASLAAKSARLSRPNYAHYAGNAAEQRYRWLRPGNYRLTLGPSVFALGPRTLGIAAGRADFLELALEPAQGAGLVAGVLRRTAGDLVVYGKVELVAVNGDGSYSAAVKRERHDGQRVATFRIEDVPPGLYRLRVPSRPSFRCAAPERVVSPPAEDLVFLYD